MQIHHPHHLLGFEDIRSLLDASLYAALGALLALLWRMAATLRYWLGYARHTALRWITRRREILLWIDADTVIADRLGRELRKALTTSGCPAFRRIRVSVLNDPEKILYHPTYPSVAAAIVIINTDVSKLSSDNKISKKIQDHLLKYIDHGGGLVGCHDVIYRRARNADLQGAFGGRIEGFSRVVGKPVQYVKCHPTHPLANLLPGQFALADGEILATQGWPATSQALFRNQAAPPEDHPLVVARESNPGRLVWLNSCDHQELLCDAIAVPQAEYVTLLSASVQWVARCG